MADTNNNIMSVVVADLNSKLSDFAIGHQQLIFIEDKRKIAVDFNGERTFYNQIEILTTESERQALEDPVEGLFYFVLNTVELWAYVNSKWNRLVTTSNDAVIIGTLLPEAGEEGKLYVNKLNKDISVWDAEINDYVVVAEKNEDFVYEETSQDYIDSLFK